MGITTRDRVSNAEVYEHFGMTEKASGLNCGVVERVKDARGETDQRSLSEFCKW